MVIDLPKPVKTGFSAFEGGGQSLRGKNKGNNGSSSHLIEDSQEVEDAPFNLPFGQLYFGFPVIPPKSKDGNEEANNKLKNSFKGAGQTLRTKKK